MSHSLSKLTNSPRLSKLKLPAAFAPSSPFPLENCCALITGASSGLGEEFARQLAPFAKQLILVARREERLEQLRDQLLARFPQLEIITAIADLADRAQREHIVSHIQQARYPLNLLINNAGMGDYGEFASAEWNRTETMLRLNIEALTQLSHALLPQLKQTRGAILNVSSLAGLLPVPDFAVYAASKAYVSSFSEALRIELKDSQVRVLKLCPGPIQTEFSEVAQREGEAAFSPSRNDLLQIPAQECVRQALIALKRNRASHYPGLGVCLLATAISLTPLLLLRPLLAKRPRK